jgi:hypothetical protein
MKRLPPLLFIFPWTLWATAFWLQRLMRVAGGLRQIIQAELPKQKFLINRIKADKFCFFWVFSLYVGAAVYRASQDCN